MQTHMLDPTPYQLSAFITVRYRPCINYRPLLYCTTLASIIRNRWGLVFETRQFSVPVPSVQL